MTDAWGGSFGTAWADSFGSGATPVVTAVGGHFVADYRKKLKAQQKALEEREQEKLFHAKELRRQIEEARNPPKVLVKETKTQATEPKTEVLPVFDLAGNLALIERELQALSQQILSNQEELRKQQDEEDVETILHLLH